MKPSSLLCPIFYSCALSKGIPLGNKMLRIIQKLMICRIKKLTLSFFKSFLLQSLMNWLPIPLSILLSSIMSVAALNSIFPMDTTLWQTIRPSKLCKMNLKITWWLAFSLISATCFYKFINLPITSGIRLELFKLMERP
jgi:hypothetical protein